MSLSAVKASEMLDMLEKAVHAGNITAVVPEDLEIEAHNTLWNDTDSTELTLLKLAPSVPATSVTHEYTRVTSYGYSRNTGFFAERSLPPESNFASARVEVAIKLMGEIGPTFLLAALEKTQRALGTTGAQNIERVALRLSVLRKKNKNLYFSDTNTHRSGASGTRFAGIMQQIREGTDGTVGTSPYGSHIIDMQGNPLTPDTIRDRAANSITLFGMFNTLIMDPFARADFEASLDGAQRLNFPISAKPFMVGQQVAGLQTQGNKIWFETDNTLAPIYSQTQYTTDLIDGAPPTTPTVASSAGAVGGGRTSYWDASSAGNVYYMVTEIVDEREGLGTRTPTTPATYLAVAASEEVTLTITPGNPLADTFAVYRGTDADSADTEAYKIFETANSGGGAAVTVYDDNEWRPNTTCAFGLRILSRAERALHNGTADAYESARSKSASFLRKEDNPRNTIAVANLGPQMGIMALASILAEVDRPLVYSACAPEVRNPLQNIVFKNIGRL